MKYMMLIYSSPATWDALSQEERDQLERDHAELYRELVRSGEWVGGNPLADPSRSVGVRVRGGVAVTSDGPYAEVKEHLAGFYLIECDSIDRAIEYAARIPEAAYVDVEVRPVLDHISVDM